MSLMNARKSADQRTADSASDRSLMCSAHGCPNLWSTSDGNLCRWHADADPIQWPRITSEMHDHLTDKAYRAGMGHPTKQIPVMSMDEKRAIAERLRGALEHARKNPRAWVDRLNAKVDAGHKLSAAQKHALNNLPAQFSGAA